MLIKAEIDISELNSSADFFKVLSPLKENVFADDVRIIFFNSKELIHSFADLPADQLITLQKMLVYLDIPNFFCLFRSNNKNIVQELEYVCNHYATNESPIKLCSE